MTMPGRRGVEACGAGRPAPEVPCRDKLPETAAAGRRAKRNGVAPQARLCAVPGRIAGHEIARLDELMPRRYATKAT